MLEKEDIQNVYFLGPLGTELGHSAPEIVQSRIPCAYLVLTGVKGL